MPVQWQIFTFVYVPLVALVAGLIIRADGRRRRPVLAYASGRATPDDSALAARIEHDQDNVTFRNWLAGTDGRRTFTYTGDTVHIPVIRPLPDLGPCQRTLLDERTAEVLAAPDLSGHDLDGIAEQVAPGIGSVVSLGHAVEDTVMRTSVELVALHAAEVEAYDAIEANEVRLLMADFDRQMRVSLQEFADATVRVDFWAHYEHTAAHTCPPCVKAVQENSDEFRQIVRRVESTDTGQFTDADAAELRDRLSVASTT